MSKRWKPLIGIDFDGTLCQSAHPKIGLPTYLQLRLIEELRAGYYEGAFDLVLVTCREEALLQDAIAWCFRQGLVFTRHNENCPNRIERWADARKISVDYLLDDRAVGYSTRKAIRLIKKLRKEYWRQQKRSVRNT